MTETIITVARTDRRVLIADDDVQVRSALRLLLEQRQDSVLAEADSVEGVIATAQVIAPDVILLDWQLCGNENGDLLRVLRLECPSSTIITKSARPESKKCAIEAGAYAFISKNDPPEVLQVLLEVLAGKFTVSAI